MDFDTSWRALVKPGAATEFFSPPSSRPLNDRRSYDDANAWWLAELSRLAYRPRGRDERLTRVGLRELDSFSSSGIQAGLIGPADAGTEVPHVLVFRGTDSLRDWWWNLNASRKRAPGGGEIHRGFNWALNRIWPLAEGALDDLSGPVLYTGHSLGGALAVLATARKAAEVVYTFGAPRVGDPAFGETLRSRAILQVINNDDLVTRLPTATKRRPFRHTGSLYRIVSAGRAGSRRAPRPEAAAELATPFDSHPRAPSPPRTLVDHSPVNYVAHLERLLPESSGRGG